MSPCRGNWPLSPPTVSAIDPKLALRLALSAVDKSPTDGRSTQRCGRRRWRSVRSRFFRPIPSTAETAAFSPDGSRVVTGGEDGIVASLGRGERPPDRSPGRATTARCWRRAMHAGRPAARARVRRRHAPSDRRVTRRDRAKCCGCAAPASTAVAFSRDGRGSPRLWAMARSAFWRGRRVVRFRSSADTAGRCWALISTATGAASSAPARMEASASGTRGQDRSRSSTRVRSTETDVRFSPDGSLILAVGSDGWMRLWNSPDAGRSRAAARLSAHASWTTRHSALTAAATR